jgi:hypothetical protein
MPRNISPACLILTVSFGCLSATIPAFSQSVANPPKLQTPDPSYRVSIEVSSSNEALKNRVSSALSHEFRTLPDVVVTKDRYAYSVMIVGLEMYAGTTPSGTALSILFLKHYDASSIRAATDSVAKVKGLEWDVQKQNLKAMSDAYGMPITGDIFLSSDLYVGGTLEQNCKDIVAKFDSIVLEPDRQIVQAIRDSQQRQH